MSWLIGIRAAFVLVFLVDLPNIFVKVLLDALFIPCMKLFIILLKVFCSKNNFVSHNLHRLNFLDFRVVKKRECHFLSLLSSLGQWLINSLYVLIALLFLQ